jgi:hypothetical protein
MSFLSGIFNEGEVQTDLIDLQDVCMGKREDSVCSKGCEPDSQEAAD